MLTTLERVPRPGSPGAIAAGCTCPVVDNAFGNGVTGSAALDGGPHYWIAPGCPLHAGALDFIPLPDPEDAP